MFEKKFGNVFQKMLKVGV